MASNRSDTCNDCSHFDQYEDIKSGVLDNSCRHPNNSDAGNAKHPNGGIGCQLSDAHGAAPIALCPICWMRDGHSKLCPERDKAR